MNRSATHRPTNELLDNVSPTTFSTWKTYLTRTGTSVPILPYTISRALDYHVTNTTDNPGHNRRTTVDAIVEDGRECVYVFANVFTCEATDLG